MSIIKSITTSAKPFAIRGGRLRKRGGQVVSFAPHFSDLMAGASRVALGGVLILSGVAALAPTSAMAVVDTRCEGTTEILCSGPADEYGEDHSITISVGDDDTTITTAADFGIDTSNRDPNDAVTITNDNDSNVTFTNATASSIIGNGAGLVVDASGGGDVTVSTNGTIGGSRNDGTSVGIELTSTQGAADITNGSASDTTRSATIRAQSTVTMDPPMAGDIGEIINFNESWNSQATAISLQQAGNAATATLDNHATISSTSLLDGNVNLVARTLVGKTGGENNIALGATSDGVLITHTGSAAIDVNNSGDILSTATVAGNINIYSDGAAAYNNVNINAESTGLSVSHLLIEPNDIGEDEDAGEGDDDTLPAVAINIANAGTIASTASFDGAIDINGDNITHNNDAIVTLVSTAVAADHSGNGNIDITNDGAITSAASFGGTINFSSELELDANIADTTITSTAISATHLAIGDITVTNSSDISSTATFDGSINFTTSENDAFRNADLMGSDVDILTSAGGIIAIHGGRVKKSPANIGNIVIENMGGITVASGIDRTAPTSANALTLNAGDFLLGDAPCGETPSNNSVDISAYSTGIYASHANDGNITITNDGAINSTAVFKSNIVLASNPTDGVTNTPINIKLTNLAIGIDAELFGDGDIIINNNSDISATTEFAGRVQAKADVEGDSALIKDGSDLSGNALTLAATTIGINAVHSGTGNIAIINDGNILTRNSYGIANLAYNPLEHWESTGIKVVHNGTGGEPELDAEDLPWGVSVANTGSITSDGDAINIFADPFDTNKLNVKVTNVGNIDAGDDGINIDHFGLGDILVENTGDIQESDDGIDIDHEGSGNITVTNAGKVDARYDGIDVDQDGLGDISVDNTATGQIFVSDFAGFYQTGTAEGMLLNFTGEDDASAVGIETDREDLGNIEITNAGIISSTSSAGLSLIPTILDEKSNIVEGDTSILGNRINLGSFATGIDARQDEVCDDADRTDVGSIDITNTGTITTAASTTVMLNSTDIQTTHVTTATEANGIYAKHHDVGVISITNDKMITASATTAINVTSVNFASNWIDASTNAFGIQAVHNGSAVEGDAITITNNGTINASVVTTATLGAETHDANTVILRSRAVGISATNTDSSDTISITNNGKITATVVAPDGGPIMPRSLPDDAVVPVAFETETLAFGVEAFQHDGGDISITNNETGSISGTTAGIVATTTAGSITITNDGTVGNSAGSGAGMAIYAGGVQAGQIGTVLIENNGTLTGAIESNGVFADTITNSATGIWNTANGDNDFGAGEDIVTNAGTINAAGATFSGLENLVNSGTLTLANDMAGDTLYTDGNVTLNTGGNLVLDVSRDGADMLSADGDIVIAGGTLTLNSVGPRLMDGTVTLIEGATITGDFDDTNVKNTAVLDFTFNRNEYDTTQTIELTVEQVRDFADVALTPNQSSIGAALDSIETIMPETRMARGALPVGNELVEELAYLPDAATLNDALDQLSGDSHATLRSSLADDSRLSRNAILNRLQTREGSAIWGEIFYGAGDLNTAKNRNTGNSKRDAWGAIMGADANVTENVTVGFAASLINHENDQQSRSSKVESETVNLLAYVGAESGQLRFKLGAGYAWGDVNTARSVSFGRFSDRLMADYDASQFQAFAELGYRLPLGGGYVEPMVNVAYVDTTTDGFTEKGGLAALTVEKRSEVSTVSTVGARFSTAKSGIFSVNGMAGWQHGFGKLNPTSVMSLSGSDSFIIAGAPQSRNAAVAQVEAKFDVGETVSLGLGYDGVLGNASKDHAAKVSVRLKF